MFLPERWLSKDLREKLEPDLFNDKAPYALNQTAFLPFSYGPANCVGKQLAYVEMRMTLCHLLHRFTLKFAPGYNPWQYEENYHDHYIVVKGPLPVVLESRQ
jgi:cytochrome P450